VLSTRPRASGFGEGFVACREVLGSFPRTEATCRGLMTGSAGRREKQGRWLTTLYRHAEPNGSRSQSFASRVLGLHAAGRWPLRTRWFTEREPWWGPLAGSLLPIHWIALFNERGSRVLRNRLRSLENSLSKMKSWLTSWARR
jgi:hypothetical protein